jgi:hypothetical protein
VGSDILDLHRCSILPVNNEVSTQVQRIDMEEWWHSYSLPADASRFETKLNNLQVVKKKGGHGIAAFLRRKSSSDYSMYNV